MAKEEHKSLENLEIHLRSCLDSRGRLTFAEENWDIPFPLKRVFWITDVPRGAARGGHAHRTCKEVLCCVRGSLTLRVDNGRERRVFCLDSPDRAVLIPEGVWCSLEGFTQDAVVVVGASEAYSAEGYVRDYQEFVSIYGESDSGK